MNKVQFNQAKGQVILSTYEGQEEYSSNVKYSVGSSKWIVYTDPETLEAQTYWYVKALKSRAQASKELVNTKDLDMVYELG